MSCGLWQLLPFLQSLDPALIVFFSIAAIKVANICCTDDRRNGLGQSLYDVHHLPACLVSWQLQVIYVGGFQKIKYCAFPNVQARDQKGALPEHAEPAGL